MGYGSRKWTLRCLAALALAVLVQRERTCFGSSYSLELFMPASDSLSASSVAQKINNRGEVGVSYLDYSGDVPVAWSVLRTADGSTIPLISSGTASYVSGINDLGEVTGAVSHRDPFSTTDNGPGTVWFRWKQGEPTTFFSPAAGADYGFIAKGINNSGNVAGFLNSQGGYVTRDGTFVPVVVAGNGAPVAINNDNVVVGNIEGPMRLPTTAFTWKNGVTTYLGSPTGDNVCHATDINDAGAIVGVSEAVEGPWSQILYTRPFICADGTCTYLPTADDSGGAAAAINRFNDVVGADALGATLWSDGIACDLNSLTTLPDGIHLVSAYDINDAGEIVGMAFDENNRQIGFLLTPASIPEPALLLYGFAPLSLAMRRSRQV